VLGRLTYDLNAKKGFISSNTLYEVRIRPGTEAGVCVCTCSHRHGYVTHGLITTVTAFSKSMNFEVAAFQSDANFIRVFLPRMNM